jgi:NhaA family Na+:H+ antiporter
VGLLTRVKKDPGEQDSPGHAAEHFIRPISAGFAVPVFAFFAAGVTLSGGLVDDLQTPIAMGIILGLVIGKPVGVVGVAAIMAKFTRAQLSPDIKWRDVGAVGMLAGIGFTVSLLISELAFYNYDNGLALEEDAKIAVLVGSVVSALLATAVLLTRNRYYRKLYEREELDADHDGIPDVYQHSDSHRETGDDSMSADADPAAGAPGSGTKRDRSH